MTTDARRMWRVEVRDSGLRRVGPCDVWDSLDATIRHRRSGGWVLSLPAGHRQARLFQPGGGILVWAPWSHTEPWFTGPITELTARTADTNTPPTLHVTGVDDTALLADRLALPDPTQPPDQQTADSHWTWSGPAEGAIRSLVDVNAGNSAQPDRRLCDADPGRRLDNPAVLHGSDVQVNARFDTLLALCDDLAAVDNLTFSLVQPAAATDLQLLVGVPVDRSGEVRLSQSAGTIAQATATTKAPAGTHVLVAGSGEGTARALTQVADPAAAAEWSRRVEIFKDARDTDDPAILTQRGQETLAETTASGGLQITPVDMPRQRFGEHYQLGDTVTVDIGVASWSEVVTAVTVKATADSTTITPTLGDEQAASAAAPRIYMRVRDLTRRLESLERRQ